MMAVAKPSQPKQVTGSINGFQHRMQWHLCRRLTGSLPRYLIILKGNENSSNGKVRILLTHDIRPDTAQDRWNHFTIIIILSILFILRTISLQNNNIFFDFVIASTVWGLLTVKKSLKIQEWRGKITFVLLWDYWIHFGLLNTWKNAKG